MSAFLQLRDNVTYFLSGPITPENAEMTLRGLARGWYAVGFLDLLLYGFIVWTDPALWFDLLNGAVCLVAGHYLAARKSRAVAVLLLVYALLVAITAFLAQAGAILDEGGRNIVLAVVILVMGWRGCRATYAYQRHTQHRIAWNHVFWITFVVITAFLIAFISIVAVLSVIKPDMPDEMSGKIGIAAAAALAITALTLLTHQHPFHRAHLLFPEQA